MYYPLCKQYIDSQEYSTSNEILNEGLTNRKVID